MCVEVVKKEMEPLTNKPKSRFEKPSFGGTGKACKINALKIGSNFNPMSLNGLSLEGGGSMKL